MPTLYTVAPDYCRAGVALPGIRPIEAVGSKDARLYLGGAITSPSGVARHLADSDQGADSDPGRVQGFSFRFSASFGCGYFLKGSVTPEERHSALNGQSFGITLGTPNAHGGISIPQTGSAPVALEGGIGPNAGISLTSVTEIRPGGESFGNWIRERRSPEER